MLDIENAKIILQAEVDKRERAKAKLEKYRASENKNKALEECYERRYIMYCFRFEGMCDMLYDLGFRAWSNDDNEVFVETCISYDNTI